MKDLKMRGRTQESWKSVAEVRIRSVLLLTGEEWITCPLLPLVTGDQWNASPSIPLLTR
jgi:hypothetical protein